MSREYVLDPFQPLAQSQIDYAAELNPQQHAAVTAPPGPALVIAGAGAGKTRTLIYRVAFLLEQGVTPERILLLTFTNKAAREMMRRVGDLLGNDLANLWGGTFHAIGNRILRRHADLLGYPPDFTILDREDAEDMVSACLAQSGIDLKETRFPKPEVLANVFSLAANMRQPVPEILAEHYDYFSALAPEITTLRESYAQRKRAAAVMDFDDLLALWLQLLREQPAVLELYQRRFQFILVDEYQDTNQLQSELIDQLAGRHQNVMAVGDDSQSIYSWRGANFLNILQFSQRYPAAKIYKVEINYRSTPEILALANAAIAPNVNQYAKLLAPTRTSGPRPALVACADAAQQAAFVAQRALQLREEGVNLNDMAVLYRSHFHALELQLELTRRGIPFSITSGIRFFEQAHVKDVSAWLKLICNPRDELAFKRLVCLLRGIGAKGADKLWGLFSAARATPAEASVAEVGASVESAAPAAALPPPTAGSGAPPAAKRNAPPPLARALQACARAVPKKAAVAWAQFVTTVAQLEQEPVRRQTAKLIRLVIEAGYEDYLKEKFPNYRARLEDLEQLANFAQQFAGPEEFLAQLALLTNLEAEEDQARAGDDERMRLSTIHQAKGLEFPVVFIIMLCDGLFPSARSLESPAGEEEERRLFYVAVTRAKNELYLSYPLMRFSQTQGGVTMQLASRFVKDLPPDLVEEWNLRPFHAY